MRDAFREQARGEFARFVSGKKLRKTAPRDKVLEVFLGLDRHVTAEELWKEVRRKDPAIGSATVYRALKLLCESGIAQEVRVSRERAVFEHKTGHAHHDHLVCESCGRLIEAADPMIEELQDKLAQANSFVITSHSLVIRGICSDCRPKRKRK
jgi:Fur family ferric uptake transcriptional regulator